MLMQGFSLLISGRLITDGDLMEAVPRERTIFGGVMVTALALGFLTMSWNALRDCKRRMKAVEPRERSRC